MFRRGSRTALALAAGLATGCAAPRPVVKEKPDWREAQAGPRGFDPWAYQRDIDCEAAARGLYARDRAEGWRAFTACVKRHDFTEIRVFSSGAWDAELGRPEVPALIARVIAHRGGDAPTDLGLIRRHRKLPRLHTLTEALQKQVGTNGLVIAWMKFGAIERIDGDQVASAVEMHREGLESAPLVAVYQDQSGNQSQEVVGQSMDSADEETGQRASVSYAGADRRFATGTDALILARFEGFAGDDGTVSLTVLQLFAVSGQDVY